MKLVHMIHEAVETAGIKVFTWGERGGRTGGRRVGAGESRKGEKRR